MGDDCLLRTECLTLAVAAICAIVAAAKRVIAHEDVCGPRPPPHRVVKVTAASATVNGIGGAAGCLLAMETGGLGAKTAAPLVILAMIVLDLSTPAGRAWLFALARSIRSTLPEPPSVPPSPPRSTRPLNRKPSKGPTDTQEGPQ